MKQYTVAFVTFNVKNKYYIYLTKKNMFYSIDNETYLLFNKFFNMEEVMEYNVKDMPDLPLLENFFFSNDDVGKYKIDYENTLKESIKNKDKIKLTIELTEDCNLSCRYCINNNHYVGFRSKSSLSIDENNVDNVILDLNSLLVGRDVIVAFYGGEPFLKIKLLKKIINKIEKSPLNVLMYTITTNLTILNNEIIDLINKYNINVCVSFDGYPELHNFNRRFLNQKPTYKVVYKNIQLLLDKINNPSQLSIATTISPYTDFSKLEYFFNNNELFNQKAKKRTVSKNRIKCNFVLEKKNDFFDRTYLKKVKNLFYNQYELYLNNIATNISENVDTDKFCLTKSLWFDELINLNQYYGLSEIPINPYRGLCIPGDNSFFVTVKGEYKICNMCNFEPDVFTIGYVGEGVDYKKCKYLFEKSSEVRRNNCSICWGVNMCSICLFVIADPSLNDLNDSFLKNNFCLSKKKLIYNQLKAYLILLIDNNKLISEIFSEYEPKYIRRMKSMKNIST